jgi:hypothetical protein
MTWVKLDDQFPIHRKVGALSDAAFRLHVEALCWSARNLTDGRIETEELRTVTRIGRPERYATELVRWGAWRETDTGWEIHDYLDYQQSRSKVLATRKQRSKAGKVGGTRSGEARRGAKKAPARHGKPAGQTPQGSKPEANTKQVASRSVEPPAPFLLTKEGTGSAPASLGGARPPSSRDSPSDVDDGPIPHWSALPAYGQAEPRALPPAAAAAREAAKRAGRPKTPSPAGAFDRLVELTAVPEPDLTEESA